MNLIKKIMKLLIKLKLKKEVFIEGDFMIKLKKYKRKKKKSSLKEMNLRKKTQEDLKKYIQNTSIIMMDLLMKLRIFGKFLLELKKLMRKLDQKLVRDLL